MLTKIGDVYIDLDAVVAMWRLRSDGDNRVFVQFDRCPSPLWFNIEYDDFVAALDSVGIIAKNEGAQEIVLTPVQISALRALYGKGYRYLAASKTGAISAYKDRPYPDGAYWTDGNTFYSPKRVGTDLPFEFDDGAVEIAYILGIEE